jgi:hypothetical protein
MAGASAIPGVWGNMMTFLGKHKVLPNRTTSSDKSVLNDRCRGTTSLHVRFALTTQGETFADVSSSSAGFDLPLLR